MNAPKQGSTQTYCERFPTEEDHAWETHTRGGNSIYLRICTFCRYIDWENLEGQADKIRAEAVQRVITEFTQYIQTKARQSFERTLEDFIKETT